MIEEDPSIRLARNEETGELLLSGMGPLHLEVVKERIREEHGIDLRLSTPHVAYHETISRDVNAKGRHKKQSGGHGQFGEIEIIMEPLQRGEGVKFVSQIKGGVIPSALIGKASFFTTKTVCSFCWGVQPRTSYVFPSILLCYSGH